MSKIKIQPRPGVSNAQIKAERTIAKELSKSTHLEVVHRPTGINQQGDEVILDHFFIRGAGPKSILLLVSITPDQQAIDSARASTAALSMERKLKHETGRSIVIQPVISYPNHSAPTYLDDRNTMPNLF